MRDTGSSDILMYCELDGLPPTVNHLYRSMRNGTRYKTTEGRKWQEGATLLFALSKKEQALYAGDVSLEIAFYPSDNRSWDIDNRVKALQDCLAPAGVIKNDKQVQKLVVERLGKVERAKTLVLVRGRRLLNKKGGEQINELKPCPFCGSPAVMHYWSAVGEYWVACSGCEMRTAEHYDPKIAALVWNRRVEVKGDD